MSRYPIDAVRPRLPASYLTRVTLPVSPLGTEAEIAEKMRASYPGLPESQIPGTKAHAQSVQAECCGRLREDMEGVGEPLSHQHSDPIIVFERGNTES